MEKMQVAGIVAEYNPFHNGHGWMIEQLRGQGCHTVVCVMSGSFVQRAEAALYPAHIRAKAALAAGADLVLRLPTPYAVASAEQFATAATGILAALGCVDTLAFGAETPGVENLQQLAALLQKADFANVLKNKLGEGASFAAARAAAAEEMQPGAGALLNTPNNILGIEYCKALQTAVPKGLAAVAAGQGKPLPPMPVPFALPRRGALHDGIPADGVASASWLRQHSITQGGAQALQGWVPGACLPIYLNAQQAGQQINPAQYQFAVLARLRGKPLAAFAPYAGQAAEGLAARMASAARQATTLQELYELAKSKRFAHSRIRRVALAAALGLPANLPAIPPFIQVLGANGRGLALLKKAKHTAVLPVATSLAKLAKTSPAAATLVAAEAHAEDLYTLCQQQPQPGGRAFTQPAILEK
ncbi:nucleotidyltransferase family protein [Ruminococcaceae bacterium OttesenSCG-928-A16]|nr:nucleotidyltransferase family protein [Ruminococcaceae bacterium OttesenSCG-928-A16]